MSQSKHHYLQPIPADWQATLALSNGKSSREGEWKNKAFSLDAVIRSLTQHNIGPKDGACFLQGSARDGVRKATAMERLYIIGVDVDNGMPSAEIDEIIRDRGLFCIRYTTHSHGKDYTEAKKDDWIKYSRANEGASIAEYLVAQKRYLPEIAAQAEIASERFTPDGKILTINHPAMDKNRLVFILAKPWDVNDYDLSSEALKAWKDAYMGFASWLGIVVDKSCTDPSRLFYMPRHDSGALYEAVVHEGNAVDVFSLPKTQITRQTSGNVFLDAASAMGAGDDNRALKSWAARFGDRFLIADALEEHSPTYLRPEKDRESIHHIECPFESQHTSFGGSGTFVTNAGESPQGGFVIRCMHDSCSDRDRLTFLAEMIEQEWLPESAITDDAFLIEIEDDERAEDPAPVVEMPVPTKMLQISEVKDAATADQFLRGLAESDTPVIQATEEINKLARAMRDDLRMATSRADILALYKTYVREYRRAVREAEESSSTAAEIAARNADKARKESDKEKDRIKKAREREKQRKEEAGKPAERCALFIDEDYLKAANVAMAALVTQNEKVPRIFRNSGSLCRVTYNENSYPKIERLGPNEMRYALTLVTRTLTEKASGEGFKEDPPLMDIVQHILATPEPPFPVLSGIVTAPVFGPDGKIETKPGYAQSSQLFFEPGDLEIPSVPCKPTDNDVDRALDLLMGNALVDFPFDGPEGGQSERAHALCMVLQPFARQLINGATPIYLIVKPTPGTGASKLVNIYSMISTGREATAQTETRSEDEFRKRITSVLLEASPTFYLDNINYRIDSSALASAVTSMTWTDRILGATKTIEAPVRHTWIFAGNNPTMSNEIARRCVRIRLDAKVERPELRTHFKHKDLEGWIRDNRSELIWACLTLIQNWIAKGRPEGDANKGSFEPWSRVMGGILKCCGYTGFLANDSELRDASDEEGSAIKSLISSWWQRFEDQPTTVGGPADGLFDVYKDEEIALPISGTHPDQQKVSFGIYIGKLAGRIFSIEDENGDKIQLRIDKATVKKNNKVCWRLCRVP